ncbi:MAG: hypothetical protein H9W81_15340, partial [Enterococcus sp.]|nr:hypothetical protein [Enterococcus sp.]
MSYKKYKKCLYADDLKAWADEIEEKQLSYDEFMQQYSERFPYHPTFIHVIDCETCKKHFAREHDTHATYMMLKYRTYNMCEFCKMRARKAAYSQMKKSKKETD